MTHSSSPPSSPSAGASSILERDGLAAEIERRLGVDRIEADSMAGGILAAVFDALAGGAPPARRRKPRLLPQVDATSARALCDRFVESIPAYPATRFAGRGVVTCAGGRRLLRCAWVMVHMLRRTGCGLPVQLWHLGPEEVDATVRGLFEPLDVVCVDALEIRRRYPARILDGWELKPYAILHSGFEELVFLDADNVPLVDPAVLFDSAAYRRSGALFWPDAGPLDPSNPIFDVLGLRCPDEPAFESGQIVVCKPRHWRPLALTMHMNEHSDFYYRHVHGDKETFHLAWRLLGADYTMVPTPVDRLRGGAFCQHDLAGRRMFLHRLAKWERRDLHIEGFDHEQDCFDLVARFDEARGSPA